MSRFSSFLAAVSLSVCSIASQASVIYTYDSANFTNTDAPYTTAMRLHLQFELANALGAGTTNSIDSLPGFQFTAYDDGFFHSVEPGAAFQDLSLTISGTGNVSDWLISLVSSNYEAITGGPNSGQALTEVVDFSANAQAYLLGANGSWNIAAVPATVPEPGSIALVGAALAAIAIARKRAHGKA